MKKQAWIMVGGIMAAGIALAQELEPVNVPEQVPGLIDWFLASKAVSIVKYSAIITMIVQLIKTAAVLFGGKLPAKATAGVVALVVLDRTSGRSGAAAGTILQHLADVGWARNDLDAAAANYEEAARQFSAALGDNHPRHAATLNGLARVRRDQQRPQEAEELYRMAIHVYERHQAKHPADLVVPLHNLALLLMEQGRLDEAGPLLERAVLLAEKSGLKKGDAQVVLRTMIRYCQAAGDVERAAEFEKRADELALDVWAK